MCGPVSGIVTSVVGGVLVVVSCIVGFVVLPNFITNTIIDELVLQDGSEALERFQELPLPLDMKVFFFNIENPDEVLAGGKPRVREVGPYVYTFEQRRVIENMTDEHIDYRIIQFFEFDAAASAPYTEDDMLTIANVPYNAVIQVAETDFPSLMGIMNGALPGVFGEYNSPIMNVNVRDLLFDGIQFCVDATGIPTIVCNLIKEIAEDTPNIEEQEDGSLRFSLMAYRDGVYSDLFKADRGLKDHSRLGELVSINGYSRLFAWPDEGAEPPAEGEAPLSVCNMINGTDGGMFAPFVDYDTELSAYIGDICRSVGLKYEFDTEYEGIPAYRFAAKEWVTDNNEGCFCLNASKGINDEDGCLLDGALDLYSCVGAYLVLTFPHFLYADQAYVDTVDGLSPNEEQHGIYMDIEPYTAVVVRAAKRAQFNIFLRPVTNVAATNPLFVSLTPLFWIEEGVELTDELVQEIKDELLSRLTLVNILVPVLIAFSAAVIGVGIVVYFVARRRAAKNTV